MKTKRAIIVGATSGIRQNCLLPMDGLLVSQGAERTYFYRYNTVIVALLLHKE